MPIPKPSENEEQDKFMSRCMSDSMMNKEFPDRKQKAAVCISTFNRSKKKKMMSSSEKKKEEEK